MWLQELGDFYDKNMLEEGWQGMSVDVTRRNPKGMKAPTLASPGLSYRNNKMGTKEPTMASSSDAGNVLFGNPYEQEETISGSISKQEIINLISELESELDEHDNSDRVAIMMLGKLKNKIL